MKYAQEVLKEALDARKRAKAEFIRLGIITEYVDEAIKELSDAIGLIEFHQTGAQPEPSDE